MEEGATRMTGNPIPLELNLINMTVTTCTMIWLLSTIIIVIKQ